MSHSVGRWLAAIGAAAAVAACAPPPVATSPDVIAPHHGFARGTVLVSYGTSPWFLCFPFEARCDPPSPPRQVTLPPRTRITACVGLEEPVSGCTGPSFDTLVGVTLALNSTVVVPVQAEVGGIQSNSNFILLSVYTPSTFVTAWNLSVSSS